MKMDGGVRLELGSERLARVRLNLVFEPGDLRVARSVAERGAEETVEWLLAKKDDFSYRLAEITPERVLHEAAAEGIRFLIPTDPEWPQRLNDLAFPAELHERGGVPVGLWVRGPLNLAQTSQDSVAIVGARSATTYGAETATELGFQLGSAGYGIISGAAFGIDQAAHRGALAAEAPTIAVLACGVDQYYPRAHQNLLQYIGAHGLVVSETPPGGVPLKIRFLSRNRLIAALSQGTVVVEAAVRSGALTTANWADRLSRVVMGVPGPITSATSQGVHQMLRSRGAILVTRAVEVQEALAPMGQQLALPLPSPGRSRDALMRVLQEVLDGVPVKRGADTDTIARTVSRTTAEVAQSLTALQAAGLVEQLGGTTHSNKALWRLAPAALDK